MLLQSLRNISKNFQSCLIEFPEELVNGEGEMEKGRERGRKMTEWL